jgi:hypothetical protein
MPTSVYTSDVPERSALETLLNLYNKLVADVNALRAHYAAHGTLAPSGVPAATSDTVIVKK